MNYSFKKYTFISCAVTCAAILLYAAMFYHLYTIERGSNSLGAEVVVLKKVSDEQMSLRQLESEVKDDVVALQNSVVTSDGQVDAINFLESVAREEGTFIEILSVSERPQEPYAALDFKLVSEGSWKEVMTFLAKLESMSLKARILRVDLERIDSVRINDPGAGSSAVTSSGSGILSAAPKEQKVRQTPGWRIAADISILKEIGS
ncbi:MAG TPA: hypothetical protein PLF31_02945 [Candidatus Paceibacterota bacterium]|nr:hypothetical protein [Candidatus Paceibacterota bacterium]